MEYDPFCGSLSFENKSKSLYYVMNNIREVSEKPLHFCVKLYCVGDKVKIL